LYNYSYIAHARSNYNVSTPSYPPFETIIVTNIDANNMSASISEFAVTATLVGIFNYQGTPATFAEVTGTITSKTIYVNDEQNFTETWAEGTDVRLDVSDFAYELSKLSGNDYFEGSRTTGFQDGVQGLAGNDRFKGFGDSGVDGMDRFFGGSGVDTSVYQGKISEYQINSSKGTDQSPHIWDSRSNDANTAVADVVRTPGFYVRDTVSNRDGMDGLAEVERLEFEVAEANGANRLALDIVGNGGAAAKALGFDLYGNGGKAAKIIGALWGKESVENPTFVGIVLHYLDSGVSYEALLDLALDAILGANKTNEAIVELVYTNLVAVAPTDAETKELTGYMDSGAYSQSGFARAIAELDLNATNINLVGLTDTGLQYAEYGA
jgi:hypothetical protein